MPSHDRRIAALGVKLFVIFGLLFPPALGYSSLSHKTGRWRKGANKPHASLVARKGAGIASVAFCADTTSTELLERSQRTKQRDSRRGFLTSTVVQSASVLSVLFPVTTANAFDNRLNDKYADAPATTGAQPKDLGVATRKSRNEGSYRGLKACGNSPNCLASSNPVADLPVRTIPGWNGGSIKDVKKVIDTYQVGQNEIDGGGFKVIEYDEKENYLYVQFQSYKAGYIDDFECWYNLKSGKFDVRSSSRVGYSDLGVNNLRLEYIAGRLEKEFKWTFERKNNGLLA